MLRISKLTDYAIVLATRMATASAPSSGPSLAEATRLPKPTVSKILKSLCRAGLVSSTRGAAGGYSLSKAAERISVGEIIEAIEGPIAVTECTDDQAITPCAHEGDCGLQANWQRINEAVSNALSSIPLSVMAQPYLNGTLIQLGRIRDSGAEESTSSANRQS